MNTKARILAAATLLLTATGASATMQTISRSGSIFHQFGAFDYNPNGDSSVLDLQVGDAINLTITYDDAELGPLVGGLAHSPNPMLTNPNYTGVALGNGNPANSVSFTVGNHTVGLADFACAYDPNACELATGFDFHFGPTAIFYKGKFIGLDSLFGIGGSPFSSPSIGQFVKYALVDGDPTVPAVLGQPLRTDFVYIQSEAGLVFLGKFDIPGVTAGSVPEPASWALMIGGFGAIGSIARRRRPALRVSHA